MRPTYPDNGELAPLRLAAAEVRDPVLKLLLERAGSDSRPRARADSHVLCLAIEGGAVRGSVAAGMCLVLEAAGLMSSFDRVYGCSAGALTGCYAAAGQAAAAAANYEDAASRRYIDPRRIVRGLPAVKLDLLIGELVEQKRPLSAAGVASGPEFRAVATSLEATPAPKVLSSFDSVDELVQAVRVSCSSPVLSGGPTWFRGERLADGALTESIPFRTALREGATHVLVLRSRSADFRLEGHGWLVDLAIRRQHPDLLELLRDRPRRYNGEARALERLSAHDDSRTPVTQIAVPPGPGLVDHVSTDGRAVLECMRSGADAMAARVLRRQVEVLPRRVALAA